MWATSAAQATVVVSVAARYPCKQGGDMTGASSGAQRFWSCIAEGANLSCTVPATRWEIDAFYAPELTNHKM